jgi:hypothetical protein
MATLVHRKHKVHLERFSILAPIPPFVEILLHSSQISPGEFRKIAELAASYPNDPRMIEMVRKAGDASAKVPYLLEYGESRQSILETLREVAAPHVEHLKKLPDPVQATIHTLLSINMVPRGYEIYGIAALLEINQMQKEITETLRGFMVGRRLAQEFHENNQAALNLLDQEWRSVRKSNAPWPFVQSLPEHTQMQFIPTFYKDCLVSLREMCVIVDAPDAQELRDLTPRVLQSPLPEDEAAPATGSADWLLRVVGKVGRHFTRALLDIILQHLAAERIHPGIQNFDQINYEAHDALRSLIERSP